jgi:hypothetical protein
MDAALRLGRRDSLHAVDPALVLELGVDLFAAHAPADLLEAAGRVLGVLDLVEAQLVALGVAVVHAPEVGHEQAGLVATGPSADLEDDVLAVEWVLGRQEPRQLGAALGDTNFERTHVGLGQLAHVGVVEQLAGLFQLSLELAEGLICPNERAQVGVLAGELEEALLLGHDLGVADHLAQLLVALANALDLGA